jgi:hypothetical protein
VEQVHDLSHAHLTPMQGVHQFARLPHGQV